MYAFYNLQVRYDVFSKIDFLLNKLRVRYCVLSYIGILDYNLPVRYGVSMKISYLLKRKHNVDKTVFLTENVSAILQTNTPPKYKDPGCPTISCIIGNFSNEQALLDLGASVNLLPYSVYK